LFSDSGFSSSFVVVRVKIFQSPTAATQAAAPSTEIVTPRLQISREFYADALMAAWLIGRRPWLHRRMRWALAADEMEVAVAD
jgi:hypothetical protein